MKKHFKTLSLIFVMPFVCFMPQVDKNYTVMAQNSLKTIQALTTKPLYYERLITENDLKGRTLRELSLMRNTIYARAGNPFRKKWLRDYFMAQPWYKPATKIDFSKLTELDKKNAAIIVEYETHIPHNDLVERKQKLSSKKTPLSQEDRVELQLLLRALGETPSDTEKEVASDPITDIRLLDKLLTVDQLSDYSRRDLRILRNTIYARRGREFKSLILQDYFNNLEWYKADPKYTDAKLTDIDKRNIKIVLSVENSVGGPLTEFDNQKEDGWFSGS